MAGPQQKAVTLPRSLTSVAKSQTAENAVQAGQRIADPDANSWNTRDPRTLRATGQIKEALRILSKESGTLSTALFNMVQIADSGYKIAAYNQVDGSFSEEGTQLANSVVANIDLLFDYTKGYAKKRPLPMVVQTMLRETALTGGIAAELVLDKQRLPDRIQVVDYSRLFWNSDGKGGKWPSQTPLSGGDEISLNIPTFFTEALHLEANTSYSVSMFRASLDGLFHSTEFISDMRRVLFKSGHSRLVAILNSENIRASAPADIQKDDKKLQSYMADVKADVQSSLELIEPDDAVVAFDSVKFDTQDIGGTKSDYTSLLSTIEQISATGLKTPPSILGMRSAGSQSLSNTESLIFLRTCKALQSTVESVMSRALTLASRLYGAPIYVKLKFNPIDLRPESELQAYKTMKESGIYQQLSYGLISDAYAMYLLGLPFNPEAKLLSGTGFYNSTDTASVVTPDNSEAAQRNMNSDTPKNAGGRSQ